MAKPEKQKAMPAEYGTPAARGGQAHGVVESLVQKLHDGSVANSNYFGNIQNTIKSTSLL